jgi:anti-sigma factor RsiW
VFTHPFLPTTTVNCPDIQIKATAILDGEALPANERVEVEEHLERCAECKFTHGLESSIKQLLRTRFPYLTVPEQIYSRLKAELDSDIGPSTDAGNTAYLWH